MMGFKTIQNPNLAETKNPVICINYRVFKCLMIYIVVPAGIEPATQGFSVLCSTN